MFVIRQPAGSSLAMRRRSSSTVNREDRQSSCVKRQTVGEEIFTIDA
jgi:hypothetical protein